MDEAADGSNADQVAYWNGRTGEKWALLQSRMDGVFEPLTRELLRVARTRIGESVLDVGCGCGATVLALASAVGTNGRVTGVDVSEPMLAVARERVRRAGLGHVELLLADASMYALPPASCDLLFSRFGVMFFEDPTAAFRHMRAALSTGGRLAFACWQPMADNPWFAVPVEAVLRVVGPQPPSDPHAPGPFAFADPARLRRILADAGWSDIEIVPFRADLPLAEAGQAAAAVDLLSQIGPASRLLADAETAERPAALAAMTEAIRPFDGPGGVCLGSAVWLVTALS